MPSLVDRPEVAELVRDVLATPQIGPHGELSEWVKAELRLALDTHNVAMFRALMWNVVRYLYFGEMRERIEACEDCRSGTDHNLAADMLLGALGRYDQMFAAHLRTVAGIR